MSKGVYNENTQINVNKIELENDHIKEKQTEPEKRQILSSSLKNLLATKESNGENKKRFYVLELLLSFSIESASICDFFSDLIVVQQLAQTTHTGWFTFSLFTMLAPYLTVYSSIMTFKIVDLRR